MYNRRAATRALASASNQKTNQKREVKARNVCGFSEKELDSWLRKAGLAEPAGAGLQLSRVVPTVSDGSNS
jgi:thermostable 8-oxoguanine DNA glycosylase